MSLGLSSEVSAGWSGKGAGVLVFGHALLLAKVPATHAEVDGLLGVDPLGVGRHLVVANSLGQVST